MSSCKFKRSDGRPCRKYVQGQQRVNRAISRQEAVTRPAVLGSLETLLATQTLSNVNTLPVGWTWPANQMRWPTDAAGMSLGPVNNPVLTAGLSLLEHMLQSDAVVSWFRYQCLPVPPSEPPSLLEIEDMEDIIAAPGGPQLLTGPQIRAQIAANWPILGVSNATHPEDWQGMSRLQTNGPVTILIATVVRACHFAFAIMHELAHVLQFKLGFGNTVQPNGSAWRTPLGLLRGEAGGAWEHTVLSGVVAAVEGDKPFGEVHALSYPATGTVLPGRSGHVGHAPGRKFVVRHGHRTGSPMVPSPVTPTAIADGVPAYHYHIDPLRELGIGTLWLRGCAEIDRAVLEFLHRSVNGNAVESQGQPTRWNVRFAIVPRRDRHHATVQDRLYPNWAVYAPLSRASRLLHDTLPTQLLIASWTQNVVYASSKEGERLVAQAALERVLRTGDLALYRQFVDAGLYGLRAGSQNSNQGFNKVKLVIAANDSGS
ncbi:hypothetical protein HDU90_008340 [Geranomyces variabilis]|nr:hypothetical protein HDU90_008340 [Geranomyces variabilis]